MCFTVPGEAALWGALPGAGPAQPDGWNGGRLRPPDPGRNPGDRQHGGGGGGHGGFGAAAEARVPRLGQLHGGRLPAGGLRHDPERLRLEHRAHLHADAGETLPLRLPAQAGHGLQLGRISDFGGENFGS